MFHSISTAEAIAVLRADSHRDGAFIRLLENRWLLGAIVISFALQALVVHIPLFQLRVIRLSAE